MPESSDDEDDDEQQASKRSRRIEDETPRKAIVSPVRAAPTPVPGVAPLRSALTATPARPSVTPRAGNLLDEFAGSSRASIGTPIQEENEEGDDEDYVNINIDEVKEGNTKKAHLGLITSVYMFDVEVCKKNGYYRAGISDGMERSNKLLFHPTLNAQVERELLGEEGKVSIVKLDDVEILKGFVIGVINFTRIGDGPQHVGDAVFLGDNYYKTLRPKGCLTPSRMPKKGLFQI